MRTISPSLERVLAAPGRSVHLRVLVDDGTGLFRDFSAMAGHDLIEDVTISEGVDQPVATADVGIRREVYYLSASPFMESSLLNRKSGNFVEALYAGRRIKIETATIAEGAAPVSGDWALIFDGYVDTVDPGGAVIRLACRDLAARMQIAFIQRERIYGRGIGSGVRPWEANMVYAVGERVVSTANQDMTAGYYFTCTVAGTSGVLPPVFSVASPVADGSVMWSKGTSWTSSGSPVETEMQAILTDNLSSPPTLYTPVSPGWMIQSFVQRQESALDALRALATQIGWDVRYLWHNGSGQYRLTLYEPERSKTTPDRTFTSRDYRDLSGLAVDRAAIRNEVEVTWFDVADLNEAGNPKRKTVRVRDSVSMARYTNGDPAHIGITEDATKGVKTLPVATKLASAVLSDSAEPHASATVDLDFFSPVMLGDLYRLQANGVHHDRDLDLAVVAFQHSLTASSARTTLTLRGRPSGGQRRWHELDGRPGVAPPGQDSAPQGPTIKTTVNAIGGYAIDVLPPLERYAEIEIHESGSSGFVPSKDTLVARGKNTRFDISGKLGERHVRVIVRDDRGNSSMSEQRTVTARGVEIGDLAQDVLERLMPVMAGAEIRFEGDALLPGWADTEHGTEDIAIEVDQPLYLERVGISGGIVEMSGAHATPPGRYRISAQITIATAVVGVPVAAQLRIQGPSIGDVAVYGATAELAPDVGLGTTTLVATVETTFQHIDTTQISLWLACPNGDASALMAETIKAGARTWLRVERLPLP